jgi:hypothetical protein
MGQHRDAGRIQQGQHQQQALDAEGAQDEQRQNVGRMEATGTVEELHRRFPLTKGMEVAGRNGVGAQHGNHASRTAGDDVEDREATASGNGQSQSRSQQADNHQKAEGIGDIGIDHDHPRQPDDDVVRHLRHAQAEEAGQPGEQGLGFKGQQTAGDGEWPHQPGEQHRDFQDVGEGPLKGQQHVLNDFLVDGTEESGEEPGSAKDRSRYRIIFSLGGLHGSINGAGNVAEGVGQGDKALVFVDGGLHLGIGGGEAVDLLLAHHAFALAELGADFAGNGAAGGGGLDGIAQFDIQQGDFEHLVGEGVDDAAQADGGDGQQVGVVGQQADDDDGPDQVLQGPGEVAFDDELSPELDDEEDQGTGSKDGGGLVDGDVEGAVEDGQPLLVPGLGDALGGVEPLLEDLGCAGDGEPGEGWRGHREARRARVRDITSG